MKEIFNFFKRYFLRGLLYTLPIVIVIYITYELFVFLDGLIETNIPGLGILIMLIFITAMGFLGSSFISSPIEKYFQRILDGAPLLKTIYRAISDLLSAFVGDKKKFNKPVLVKVNKESELEKLGFITSEDLSNLNIPEGKIAVYLPHSYNFSGNLFIVPKTHVTPIDKPASEVMKFIVSGGVTEVDEQKNK